MPTLLALVLSGFRKQSIFLVRTVAQIPNIVDGVFRRAVCYVVDILLVWASNRNQEMIGYKAINEHLVLIRYNLLPKGSIFDTSAFSSNTAHIANGDSRPVIAVRRSFKFNPFFNHDLNIII